MHLISSISLLTLLTTVHGWLPQQVQGGTGKSLSTFDNQNGPGGKAAIQGVNLGSLFVYEPWIAQKTWSAPDFCYKESTPPDPPYWDSENSCTQSKASVADATAKFQDHWKNFITGKDFQTMVDYGLNTVRIPIGYWIQYKAGDREIDAFPTDGFAALAATCKLATSHDLYIILDHHAAPGAQARTNPFAGVVTDSPRFYDADNNYANYTAGADFLGWLAKQVHADQESFGNVGMIQILNEPLQNDAGTTDSMYSNFYPAAVKAIQGAEDGVSDDEKLTIMAMAPSWSPGDQGADPQSALGIKDAVYDDHIYVKWAYQQEQTKDAYAVTTCGQTFEQVTGLGHLVGEWSLSAPEDSTQEQSPEWDPSQNAEFYQGWFNASRVAYSQGALGWIYWTWKTEAEDPRWDYQKAVQQGLVATSLGPLPTSAVSSWCNAYTATSAAGSGTGGATRTGGGPPAQT